jgi:hypothetical protein
MRRADDGAANRVIQLSNAKQIARGRGVGSAYRHFDQYTDPERSF